MVYHSIADQKITGSNPELFTEIFLIPLLLRKCILFYRFYHSIYCYESDASYAVDLQTNLVVMLEHYIKVNSNLPKLQLCY